MEDVKLGHRFNSEQQSELEFDDSRSIDAREDLMQELMKELQITDLRHASVARTPPQVSQFDDKPTYPLDDHDHEDSSDQEEMQESPFESQMFVPVETDTGSLTYKQ